MFDKNDIKAGLALGIVVPLVGFAVLYGLFSALGSMGIMSEEGLSPNFRLRTTAILAIALNAWVLNKFQARRATNSMRGVMIPTFVYVAAWLIFFAKNIL
ncbi:MAG: hypothetical protein D6714_10795 [Bacteroidetes bacterium]|nr:MAG: hypothetical protein D6714_10795 [Bacteroidota bacterium]